MAIIAYRYSTVNRKTIFFCYNFFMETLGIRIKDLRKEKKLTQKELAQILSITIPTLSHWECDYQEPSSKDLLAISNAFNVSTDYLLGRTDEFGAIIPNPSPTVPALSDEERQLLELFSRMDRAQKIQALGYCEGLLSVKSGARYPNFKA